MVKRINAHLAAEISLFQMALSSIPNQSVAGHGTERMASELAKQLKELTDG
ncbi:MULTISPECIES: hypothetical protein [unclassified Mesorhizobium]|uniref:hypothetical protein n=1 Tax=unclassified Mesorhizobium TaxID=325217 RepID=UPI001672281E|nr:MULTISPECIES: hypothetical protein [unclassified Mesorhizobium]